MWLDVGVSNPNATPTHTTTTDQREALEAWVAKCDSGACGWLLYALVCFALDRRPRAHHTGLSHTGLNHTPPHNTNTAGRPVTSPLTGAAMERVFLPSHFIRSQVVEWIDEQRKKRAAATRASKGTTRRSRRAGAAHDVWVGEWLGLNSVRRERNERQRQMRQECFSSLFLFLDALSVPCLIV